jgi:hypothetical protein
MPMNTIYTKGTIRLRSKFECFANQETPGCSKYARSITMTKGPIKSPRV